MIRAGPSNSSPPDEHIPPEPSLSSPHLPESSSFAPPTSSTKKKRPPPPNESAISSIWHHEQPAEVVLARLGTDFNTGLSAREAALRLAKNGPNEITPPPQTPLIVQLLAHFTDFFSLLLLFAAILCLVAFFFERTNALHLYLAIFLFAVVFATSLFSFVQQRRSDAALREFRNFLPQQALVRRASGQPARIPARDLVVGDVILLKLGDKIPADVRILESHRFTVDNSSLTGESEPIELQSASMQPLPSTAAAAQPSQPGASSSQQLSPNSASSSSSSSSPAKNHVVSSPLEANNIAFFGCQAVDGTATAVVISTGDRTIFGNIAALTLAEDANPSKTTLQNDIHHFVLNISAFALLIGLICFIAGVAMGARLLHNIVYTIGIIVSNIPEGLLATVTVSLTASARRMVQRKVLVKQLDAVESLGSTTVICTDKTGTLTQNKMNVSHIAYGGRIEHVSPSWTPPLAPSDIGSGGDSNDDEDIGARKCFDALMHGAAVCSTAEFDQDDMAKNPGKAINDRVINGDASESGILRFTETVHRVDAYRQEHAMVAMIPFNSSKKYMVTANRVPESDVLLRVSMKGAPEQVLASCSHVIRADGERALTTADRRLIERQMLYLASRGERVMGFAEARLSPQMSSRILEGEKIEDAAEDLVSSNMCFIGLMSLIDPPRSGVSTAVNMCKSAGIKVIMVTGDHPETARSVAQNVGIITRSTSDKSESRLSMGPEDAVVLHGSELTNLSEKGWDEILSHQEIVFARTSPHQKLEIVTNLQRLRQVVTVTGDGCNDAPALKRANTGVAMGISGSDVSREAANIVILDDNFASVVNGVEEGRLVFDNLKKSIAYTLTSNVPQLVPFLAFITLHIPLPITTVLILCIDLGTDVFPAIALAYEKPETDIMRRPPRDTKTNRLLNARLMSYSMAQLGIIQTFGGFFAYAIIFSDFGLSLGALTGLNERGHFAATQLSNQRWLYSEQPDLGRRGYRANWFAKHASQFEKYFDGKLDGFQRQTKERFDILQPTTKRNPKADPSQFENMLKIIGVETKRPPCHAFTCSLDGQNATVRNDKACFDVTKNKGRVSLAEKENSDVRKGTGEFEGCFELWTPSRSRVVLQKAQTGFFLSIVVAQVFTLFACRTRILSLFQSAIGNRALFAALVVEIALTACVMSVAVLRRAFGIQPLMWQHWFLGVPFGVLIIAYDEVRKGLIRRHLHNDSGHIVPRTGAIDRAAKWIHSFTLW